MTVRAKGKIQGAESDNTPAYRTFLKTEGKKVFPSLYAYMNPNTGPEPSNVPRSFTRSSPGSFS